MSKENDDIGTTEVEEYTPRPLQLTNPALVTDKPVEGDPQIVIATPSYTHSFSAPHKRSIIQMEWLCARYGISTGHMERNGDCFIDKVRSKLVTDFLTKFKTTQNFMFWDDDVGAPPQKVLEFMMSPEPIVCGIYPKKSDKRDWPVAFASADGKLIRGPTGLYCAMMAPTGFMRIKREVLEHLARECNTFTDLEADGEVRTYFNIFESGRAEDGRYWGEDYLFCRKTLALGYNVWVDTDIEFEHTGHYTWKDNIADYMVTFENNAQQVFEASKAAAPQEDEAAPTPQLDAAE